ncbi:nitrogen fixation protein NifZ [Plectonema cf. radiosum LEGE 06105]|uniref:Nitrogen fixation protein NifZ n=1 Tax=Plectonema cf. radiosum LEGE 06105 TaxID=945769 RepID=A0A8J7F925_9CYAN|nr:nitrogen fixation protein NifZ [Plectonema radiosum]MBE9211748.1 nitrogen fixation protein NifZ [Plectonema cf. radiosum LEGE 06105]
MHSDEEELELDLPPVFELSDKVKILNPIKNDGTYPGKKLGEILIHPGEVGYVISIGTYLQRAYIYAIRFMDKDIVVGCRKEELELIERVEQ